MIKATSEIDPVPRTAENQQHLDILRHTPIKSPLLFSFSEIENPHCRMSVSFGALHLEMVETNKLFKLTAS